MTITIYSAKYTISFTYQAILENPLKPGTRGARLTLGALNTNLNLHSDWTPITINI